MLLASSLILHLEEDRSGGGVELGGSKFLICSSTPYSLAVTACLYTQSQNRLQAVYSSPVSDNFFSAQESKVVSDIGGSELTLSHDSFRSAQLVTKRFSCWEIQTGHARK